MKSSVHAPKAKNRKSSVSKNNDGLTSVEIAEHLQKENIIVSPRGDRLRIAPHFFNNREDIERLAENL